MLLSFFEKKDGKLAHWGPKFIGRDKHDSRRGPRHFLRFYVDRRGMRGKKVRTSRGVSV